MARGLVMAAPRSGSGKTVVTLGILRALRNAGMRVAPAKIGPDYIDPTYLAAAAGTVCRNLDPWAMRPAALAAQIDAAGQDAELVLCEGVMGLFDGAGAAGAGSTADLTAVAGWPVILVVDAEGQGASVAALVEGFAGHRGDVSIAGVILNRVASERHATILRAALARALPDLPCLGAIPRAADLALPSRHLGLVPAGERPDIEAFLARAGAIAAAHLALDALRMLAAPARPSARSHATGEPPGIPSLGIPVLGIPLLGGRIAIARDDAFLFAYPATIESWRRAGAALSFFSPLRDEAPEPTCDAIYLPGGYPELFAGRLAGNRRFLTGLRQAAARHAAVYGECGGYMVLGRTLIDGDGGAHEMAGLLPLATSFAARRLHLGYRQVTLAAETPLGAQGISFRGHEFHYASIVDAAPGIPLFTASDADGNSLGAAGQIVGSVMGSFIHLIDRD